jgi:hypothetical protein
MVTVMVVMVMVLVMVTGVVAMMDCNSSRTFLCVYTRVLQGCYKAVTEVLQRGYRIVTKRL